MTQPPMTHSLERYYQFHAKIYDVTRWSFLFGRSGLIKAIASYRSPRQILEVGCGTGHNLVALSQAFPYAHLTGIDLSADMLKVASRRVYPFADRVELVKTRYDAQWQATQPFDLIIFSYALSMFNPGWEVAIHKAHQDLASHGLIAVVDFHSSPSFWFKQWMERNHVRMDSHLHPELTQLFLPRWQETRSAYLGLWQYMSFLGQKLP